MFPLFVLFGMVFFFALVCLVALVIYKASRNSSPRPPVTNAPRPDLIRNVQTRPAGDGFWLTSAALAAGATILYRYYVNGRPMTGQAIFTPGSDGHFIYTGALPDQVEIINIIPPLTLEERRRIRRDPDDIDDIQVDVPPPIIAPPDIVTSSEIERGPDPPADVSSGPPAY